MPPPLAIIDLCFDFWWTFEPSCDDIVCPLQEVPTFEGREVRGVTFTCVQSIDILSRRYIIAQILGGYIACLLIYVQYHHLITVTHLRSEVATLQC